MLRGNQIKLIQWTTDGPANRQLIHRQRRTLRRMISNVDGEAVDRVLAQWAREQGVQLAAASAMPRR